MITLTGKDFSYPVIRQGMYSDGTPMVKMEMFSDVATKADTIVIRYEDMIEFMTAMFLADSIRMMGGRIQKLVLPYVPGARQDRINPTGDVLFTLASVARWINYFRFQRVVVLDPHSEVVEDLIDNVVVYPQELVAKRLTPVIWDGIIAADKGGKARAEAMAAAMNLPVFYGGKTRDVSTGKLSGFTLEPITAGRYLVVDDICDGGGTFVGLAKKIWEQGSSCDLFVSHGIFSKGVDALKNEYTRIYTTDSLVATERYDSRVTVIPLVKEMESYDG